MTHQPKCDMCDKPAKWAVTWRPGWFQAVILALHREPRWCCDEHKDTLYQQAMTPTEPCWICGGDHPASDHHQV